jgi:hypothetical protein
MASIGNDKNGHKRILFVDTDGKRPTIRLGKMSKRQAEAIKVRVEHLVAAKISRTVPDDETSRWVAGLDDVLQGRLAAVGLIKMRSSAVLGEFLNQYVASRIDAKSSTVTSWGHTVRNLNDYFGPNKPLRDITSGMRTSGVLISSTKVLLPIAQYASVVAMLSNSSRLPSVNNSSK